MLGGQITGNGMGVTRGESGKEQESTNFLVRKVEGKKPPGRPKRRRKNNTKDVREIV